MFPIINSRPKKPREIFYRFVDLLPIEEGDSENETTSFASVTSAPDDNEDDDDIPEHEKSDEINDGESEPEECEIFHL